MSDYDIGVDYTPEDLSHGLRLLPGDLKRRRISKSTFDALMRSIANRYLHRIRSHSMGRFR